MRRIGINVHDPEQTIIITEWDEKNVPVIDDAFTERKLKRW